MMPNTTMQPTNGADRFRPIGSSGAPFAADREAVMRTIPIALAVKSLS